MAGFHVTGVDIKPQPRYCGDEFIQGDALEVPLEGYDLVWASPPCQAYSVAAYPLRLKGKVYPDLVAPTRARLQESGTAWVIENVPGSPVFRDFILCGSMFGLKIIRHRRFETSFPPAVLVPPCNHARDAVTVCGHGTPSGCMKARIKRGLNAVVRQSEKREAMGIDWMNRGELSQSVPPAYSEFIGKQVMSVLK